MRLTVLSAALVVALAAAFASSSSAIDTGPSYYTPAWSPDGRQIAFSDSSDYGGPAAYPGDLYVMNADGTNVRKLTASGNTLHGATWPTWSPDGKKLAFEYRGASGAAAIYVIRSDGTGLDRISPTLFGDVACPDWSR